MDVLKELKRVLEKELEEITKKNEISPTELERVDKAVDIIKDIETICAMKEATDSYMESEYYSPRSYDSGSSYRRGYEPVRRYASRDQYAPDMERGYMRPYSGDPYRNSYMYSGHMDPMMDKMELKNMLRAKMLEPGVSDKEKMTIQQFLDNWKE